MNSMDLIRMGLKNLFRRKVRTFLTVLGVVIGTTAIVTMVSLGFGMTESFKNEISKMGSLTTINVMPSYGGMGGEGVKGGGQGTKAGTLDDKAITHIGQIANVNAVTPVLESNAKFVSGKYGAYLSILGVVPETMEAFEFDLKEGRLLQEGDTLSIVFGGMAPMTFMNMKSRSNYMMGPPKEAPVNVLGDKMVMTFDMNYGEKKQPNSTGGGQPSKAPKLYKIDGVGLLKEGNPERDYYAFMNIEELKKIIKENSKNQSGQKGYEMPGYNSSQLSYQRAMVKVNDMKNVEKVQAQIKEMGFEAYSLNDYLNSMQKTSATLQMVLGGIGAISFLVAALGITNTMVMSIYERTREIGIMKVIGASLSDIRRIFLFESGMIGFIGGVTGLGLSKLASFVLNSLSLNLVNYMGPMGEKSRISIIPLWLALCVVVFSTIVGLISGFYPARRAMKLSALEAIKTE